MERVFAMLFKPSAVTSSFAALNVSIRGIIGEMLLSSIHEIAASTAAACHSGSFEPSKLLLGLGLSRKRY
jgi:cysteine sulfinate desulfinase/cysteine desulfurase-like protein